MNKFLILGLFCLSISAYAAPRDFSAQGVGVRVVDSTESTVTFELAGSEFSSETLANPNRFVVDLPGLSLERNETKENLSLPLVERIRFGTHPNKARIVFDLQDGVISDAKKSQGKVQITFAKPGAQIAKANDAKISDATGQTVARREEVKALVPLEAVPASDEAIAKLSSIEITKGKQKGNMIVARMSNVPEFNLSQTAPSEYVLTLKDAGIATGAGETQVAAPGSGSIRSVRPVSKGRDLLLRMFA